jgi:hypothetical protein
MYIRSVIRANTVRQALGSLAIATSKELYPWIRIWANKILDAVESDRAIIKSHNYLLGIAPTGSIVKGTNIVGATDVDLFISLSHKTPSTLAEIYSSLSKYLELLGLRIREQDVSIGVDYKNLWIDLIPAKKHGGPTNDHSIYRRKIGSWTKTNVTKHVSLVKNCGRRNEIRAIKLWRNLHDLEFPSFYIELTVIEALRRCAVGRLTVNLQKVFEYLASDFAKARILDPANSNNVVSDELNEKAKQKIARAALSSRIMALKSTWEEIIW